MTNLPLAPAADKPVPKTVPCPPEDDTDSATSCSDSVSDNNTKTTSTSNTTSSIVTAARTASSTTRLAVLADLLTDLPAAARCEVITSLPPTDRTAIAKLLVSLQA